MKELKTIQNLKHFVYRYKELQKISRQLHKLYENNCNYGLTAKQEKKQVKLQKKAEEIAGEFNLNVYHQTDPRGLSLYLIEGSNNDYTQGIGVY